MFRRFEDFLNLGQHPDTIRQQNARNTGYAAAFGTVLAFVLLLADLFLAEGDVFIDIAGDFAMFLLALFAIILVRAGYDRIVASFLIVALLVVIGARVLSSEDFALSQMTTTWLVIILATAVAGREWVFATGVGSLILVYLGYLNLEGDENPFYTFLLWFSTTAFVTLMGVMITGSFKQTVGTIRSEAVRRSQLLQTSNVVASSIFRRIDVETLLDEVVNTIRDQFDEIYHAQVFLLDRGGRNALLRASTGEVGRELIDRQHSLGVGSQSVIGQVTQLGSYVLAEDTSQDPVHRANELLPDTRTELALPLRVAEGVIGALDLQSLSPRAFSGADIEVFQALADQIALAITNARLLDNLQDQLRQNQLLLERETRSRLEIEQLNAELLGQGWANYLKVAAPEPRQTIDIDSGEVIASDANVSPESLEAMRKLQVEFIEDGVRRRLALPIIVEDLPIGLIEFDIPPNEVISQGIMDALGILRDRIGILVENVRLFDQARTVASREQIVSDVATDLLQSRDIQSLVERAAPLFNDVVGAKNTFIRLGSQVFRTIDIDDNGHEG